MSSPRKRKAGDQAREAALQMIYAMDQGDQNAQQVQQWFRDAHPMEEPDWRRAAELLAFVSEHRAKIEDLVRKHAIGWRLERISQVERGILILASAELLGGPPTAAASQEAVQGMLRLAKRFSPPEARNFLRAIVEAIVRDLASPH
ncbi:MAG TPA: transcription antitermination protein NusB [Terriglobales bacterium]|nr:transcription antitermination protein NusB [Terriglobales bacterium]